MEPWQDINKLEENRRKLGIHSTYANVNDKIWTFIDEDINLGGGDFDMILSEEEKYGGRPVYLSKVEDFAHGVDTYTLYDLGFKGSLYTWWNGRSDIDCIFKRLDSKLKKVKTALAAWSKETLGDSFKRIAALEDVIKDQNAKLWDEPTMEEVKATVFGLNGDSASGLDGFTGQFYQASWEVVYDDVLNMVRAFFCAAELPKFITHTNLVLLLEKKNVGFIKGRSIVENILLTQEIIKDIRLRGKPSNLVIKLDIAKAYDKVSWLFLTKVLRQMGFVEVLGRALDELFDNPDFIGFGMPKWSQNINYLSYADDTIIFCSYHYGVVHLIMNVLEEYEVASSEKINKEKSSFYINAGAQVDEVNTVHLIIEFRRHSFPFTYLSYPIFYSRRRKDFYKNIIFKVHDMLSSWKGKLLSNGGRAFVISHMLNSMPIHLLSVVNLPAYVINQLQKMFARFYWSNSGNGRARHWASWDNLCLPKSEGGMGFRSLHDVSKVLFAKIWWNYRTKDSLWSTFMRNKYCKKINEVLVPWIQGYHIWRKMLQMRDDVEYQVWWQLKNVVKNGARNEVLLRELLPNELADHILETITPPSDLSMKDKSARYVWNYYGAPAGIRTDGKQLVQVINEWWSKPINTSLKTVYQVMPSLIVWHPWKKRNSGKHGKIMSINRLIFQITTSIQMLLKVRSFKGVTSNWLDLHEKLSQHIPKLRYTKVLWELHLVGWIKYITDGASYGFCIRDGIGDIIYAQADAVEDATNNVAEAVAILEALRYITQMQFPPCIIETNYLLMKRVLDEVWEPPWSIANQMDEIKTLMSKGAFQIFHVLREGNKLADHLAYLTLDQQHIVLVHSFW
ncbi:uncharacterized protein LOC142168987 [Nicotiana tabacum]|uniref:Uncharacterized protein LOC142168987 n=1 Tax=Nicotiana tabacum TaxID=4097 RepID=A0AC58SMS4_TOBAC